MCQVAVMFLSVLWLFLLLLPDCSCERECVKCDGRAISPDKTCSNCTGDYCYSVKYSHVHTSLKSEQSFFQGCFSSPTDLPLGCSQNKRGNVFCVCNSTDYCNELQNVKDVKDISYLTCNSIENSLWPVTEPCVHPWCVKKASIYSDETSYCNSQQMEIEMFSIGFTVDALFLPIDSCYSIQLDPNFSRDQYCVFRTNKTTPFKQKTPGNIKCFAPTDTKERMKNSTCIGQFCFTSSSAFGCISQFNREGAVLKAGLYHITPFITPFHICDSDFCNNQTIVDDEPERHFYPTKYVWSFARHMKLFVPYLIAFITAIFIWQA